MPFIMNYTDEFGDTYPNSFWKITSLSLVPVDLSFTSADGFGVISFQGYIDQSKDANAQKRQIGQKNYRMTSDQFNKYFNGINFSKVGLSFTTQAEQLALDILDTNGVSFFNGALRI